MDFGQALSAATAGALQDIAAQPADPTPVVDTPAPAADVPEVVAASPAPETPVASEVPAPAADESATTPAAATAAAIRELTLKYKGQDMTLPEDQVVKLAQQGWDYTQKTQALAEQQRQLQASQAQLQQQQSDLEAVLSDKGKLQQLVMWAAQQAEPGTVQDPLDIPTAQQVQALVQAQLQATRAELEQVTKAEIARSQFQLETNRMETEFTAQFRNHVDQLTSQLPILKDRSHLTADLKAYGANYLKARLETEGPLANITPQDVFAQVGKEATRIAKLEQARIDNHVKASLVRQQTVVGKGIEPAGGVPPAATPPQAYKLGSKELRAQAIADLQKAWHD